MLRRMAVVGLLLLVTPLALFAEDTAEERAARQAELDEACEQAREKKLAPIREEIYAECVQKQGKQPEYCRRFADGYTGTRPGGAARFYDLPECQAAFEYRRAYRR